MHCCLPRNLPLVEQRGERLIEGLHAMNILSRLHHRIDLMNFVFTDQVSNRRIGNQDFHRQRSAAAIGFWQKRLTKYALKRQRELRADLSLLHRRKYVDDAVDGRNRRVRVQGRESKVARFGDAEC